MLLNKAVRVSYLKDYNDRYNEIAPEYIPQGNPDGLPVLYKNEQMAITKWLRTKGY